jgi:type I restriction enzyme S subunit
MIHSTTTQISSIVKSSRFEPRYHYVFNQWEDLKSSKKWDVVLLGDSKIMRRITDGEHAGQVFVPDGVRFIKNSYVKDFLIGTLDGSFITKEKHIAQSRSALKPLDILFTTIGHLGACAIVPENFGEANINQNLVKIEVNASHVNPYYLAAYLNSSCTRSQISALFTGNVHSIITYPKIKSIRVLLPKRTEQDILGDKYKFALEAETEGIEIISSAMESLRVLLGLRKVEKKERIDFSSMLSSFDGPDMWTPQFSRPLFNETIEGVNQNFELLRLGDNCVDISKGDEVGSEQYVEYLDRRESDVPFIRTSDLFNYGIDSCPDFFVERSIYADLGQDIQAGDVLFSNDGKIGLTTLIQDWNDFVLQSHIRRIRLKPHSMTAFGLTPEYLFLCLSTPELGGYQSRKFEVVQSTIPTISNNLNNFQIPILPKSQIEDLTKEIKKAFQLKEEARALIAEIRRELDSLLDFF